MVGIAKIRSWDPTLWHHFPRNSTVALVRLRISSYFLLDLEYLVSSILPSTADPLVLHVITEFSPLVETLSLPCPIIYSTYILDWNPAKIAQGVLCDLRDLDSLERSDGEKEVGLVLLDGIWEKARRIGIMMERLRKSTGGQKEV
jgi:hypothetical protein